MRGNGAGVGMQKVGQGPGRAKLWHQEVVATEFRKPWLWPSTGSRELAKEGQVPEISAAKVRRGRTAPTRILPLKSQFGDRENQDAHGLTPFSAHLPHSSSAQVPLGHTLSPCDHCV